MIDYKIESVRLGSQGISAKVNIYEGDITTEQELVDGSMQDVTRYRRTGLLVSRNINLDVNQVVDLFSKYLNKRLQQEAAQRGMTVIGDQNSTNV